MLLHNLASCLDAEVTDSVPLLAAVRIDMQSVFMLGAVGCKFKTWSMAQSSAAAAVEIRVGADPNPYPSSFPF